MGEAFSVIAGKRRKGCLVYKVNGDAELVWRQRYKSCEAKKTDESGPGNGTEVVRSASPLVISTRRCGSQLGVSSWSMYCTFV